MDLYILDLARDIGKLGEVRISSNHNLVLKAIVIVIEMSQIGDLLSDICKRNFINIKR